MRTSIKLVLLGILISAGVGYTFRDTLRAVPTQYHLSGLELREGDLIFQQSRSRQSAAIAAATQSNITHCGILFQKGGEFFVFEAVQPVKYTPLVQWIRRGKDGGFAIKRIDNASQILTSATLRKMKQEGMRFLGKPYDLQFGWSDTHIYCSELLWKIYQRGAGVEIGNVQTFQEFDLQDSLVKAIVKERYTKGIPLRDSVISPKAIFHSKNLVSIYANKTFE